MGSMDISFQISVSVFLNLFDHNLFPFDTYDYQPLEGFTAVTGCAGTALRTQIPLAQGKCVVHLFIVNLDT